MPDFIFYGVSSSRAVFMYVIFFLHFFFKFFLCIMYKYVNSDTTDKTDVTRAMQGVCLNQLAPNLYTSAACRRRRKQHHTRAVVVRAVLLLWLPI